MPPLVYVLVTLIVSVRQCSAVCPTPLDISLEGVLVQHDAAFAAALAAASSKSNDSCDVLVTFGNHNWLPMVKNLLVTLDTVDIRNILLVALSDNVCNHVTEYNITCYKYPQVFEATVWGADVFRNLSYMKVEVELAAVALGYHTFIVDADIVFLKNPLPELRNRLSTGVDLQIQTDEMTAPPPGSFHLNTGFMYMTASARMAQVLRRTLDVCYSSTNKLMDQPVMNNVLREANSTSSINFYVLDVMQYQHGSRFFTFSNQEFAFQEIPCPQCVIVHNNAIIGDPAKVYRFKEHLLWHVDTDGYYSSSTAKYLEFGNDRLHVSAEAERQALKAAFKLGHTLGRIVILPEFRCFHCVNCTNDEPVNLKGCSLQKHFKVNQFEELMHGKYREHLFRYSVHVPDAIKLNLATEEAAQKGKGRGRVPTFFTREEDQALAGVGAIRLVNATGVVDAAVFRSQLQAYSSAQVIRIESLYDLEVRLNVIQDDIFEAIWKHASA